MEEVPLLQALHAKYSDQGLVILGISIDDSVARAAQTVRDKGMSWPQIATDKGFDGEVPLKYGINGTPTIFVLDRAGRIVARPGSAKQIEDSLMTALDDPQKRSARNGSGSKRGVSPVISCASSRPVPGAVLRPAI